MMSGHKCILAIVGIASLAGLEAVALYKGLDGAYFMPVVSGITAIVAGTVGFEIRGFIDKMLGKK